MQDPNRATLTNPKDNILFIVQVFVNCRALSFIFLGYCKKSFGERVSYYWLKSAYFLVIGVSLSKRHGGFID